MGPGEGAQHHDKYIYADRNGGGNDILFVNYLLHIHRPLSLPLVQNFIADKAGFMIAYIVPIFGLAYMFVYSAFLSKPPKNIDELVK